MANPTAQHLQPTDESSMRPNWIKWAFSQKHLFALLLITRGLLFGQSSSFTIISTSAAAGGPASITLSLSANSAPAALQWNLSYPQGDITAINISPSSALTAAGKTIVCSNQTGSLTCLASGLNGNTIANGPVAVATIALATTVSAPTLALGIANTYGAMADGTAAALTGIGGSINVQGWAPPPDTTAPSVPGNLLATALSTSQINLSWSPSSDADSPTITYHMERCQGSGCTNYVEMATSSGTTMTDSNLAVNTGYTYRVRACDPAGNYSAYSNSVTVTTKSSVVTPAYVQGNYSVPSTPQTMVTVPYSAAQGSGDVNVVVVGWAGTAAQVASVTDSQGNKYQVGAGPTILAGIAAQAIYLARNILPAAAGRNTVTVTFNTAVSYPDIRILEYSGIDPVTPLDLAATASGTGATSSSGSITTANSSDLLLGANDVQTSTSGPGTGFTKRLLTTPDGDIVQDRIVTSNGSYSATAPLNGAGGWVMQMIALRAAGSPAAQDMQAPTQPANLSASAISSTQVNLTWTASTDNVSVTAYRVERCQGAGCSNFSQIATPTGTSYSDTGLTVGTSYTYRVRATDAAGNLSSYSNTAMATCTDTQAPTAPTSLTASSVNSTQVNLTWTGSTDNVSVTGYRLERCQGAGCSSFTQIATPTGTSYADTGLSIGASYTYRIRATDAAGNVSAYSNTAATTTSALIAAYGFDEASGTTVNDRSGNMINGTTHNTSWSKSGRYSGALSFNGSNSYVDLGNLPLLQNSGSMSWSAWIMPTGNPPDDGQIVASSNDTTGWQFKTSPDTGVRTFAVGVTPAGSSSITQRYSKTIVSLNTWYFVAGVYNAFAKTLDIYVNGLLDDGVLRGSVPATQALSNLNTTVGMRSGGYYFKGIIDNLRIYGRALSQTEIQADMTAPITNTSNLTPAFVTKALPQVTPGRAASSSSSQTRWAAPESSPLRALSFSCSPKSANAGSEITCQVQVPANAKPTELRLASSTREVMVPTIVSTRANQSLLTFQASVDPAAVGQTVTLSASGGAGEAQDRIVVTPSSAPQLQLPAKQLVRFGTPVSFVIAATDAAGLPLRLAAAAVPPGAFFDPISGDFQWVPTSSQAGHYDIAFTATDSALQSTTGHVVIEVGSGVPTLDLSQASSCSPGSIARLDGKWLAAPGTLLSAPSGTTNELGGTEVKVNGQPVPVLFASTTQVWLLCPALDPGTPLSVTVQTTSGSSGSWNTTMQPVSPAIFSLDGPTQKQGMVSFPGSTDMAMARNYRTPAHPAQPGDVVLIWGTGLGTDPGAATLAVNFDGISAPVQSVQPVPGYAGLYTVAVEIPPATPTGLAVPIQVVAMTNAKQFTSNTVTVSVEPIP